VMPSDTRLANRDVWLGIDTGPSPNFAHQGGAFGAAAPDSQPA